MNNEEIKAEVVGFKENSTILMPLGEIIGIAPGCTVTSNNETFSIRCSDELLGRVIDGIGRPIDGKGSIGGEKYSVYNTPPNPMLRTRIKDIMSTGIKAKSSAPTLP